MDVFFYELIFVIFALIVRCVPVITLAVLFYKVASRILAHRRRVREKKARMMIYRKRSEQYRKEYMKCYRQE